MKTMKKLMALLLAAMMCMSLLSMASFAVDANADGKDDTTGADVSYDYPVTVSGLAAGDVAHFFHVIEWVGETTDHSDVAGWKATSDFASYLTQDKLTEILVGTPGKDAVTNPETGEVISPAVEKVDPTGITSEIAGEIAKLANGKTGTDVDAEGGTATLNNAAPGMYMALVTPADANTIYNPAFVSADYNKELAGDVAITGTYKNESVAKKTTVKLEKTAANASDYNNDNAKTTAVGDTVTYTVTTTIPAYGNVYTNPHFVLKDKLTALKLKADSEKTWGKDITITGVPATYTDASGATKDSYTIEAGDDNYTITFAEGYLKTLTAANADVTITYNAIVTSEAKKAVNEENNDVVLEFSHDPSNQSDYDLKKDTTQHYTFTLDAEGAGEGQSVSGKKTSELVKIGVDAAGKPITETTETSAITDTETWKGPLEGAVFGLFTDSAATVPYKAKNADGTAGETAMTATTNGEGRMTFTGLDAGTYYLKEISAPAGYVTDTTIRTVVIAAETESVKVTEWWNGSAWVATDPGNDAKSVTYDTEVLKSYTVTIDGQETAKYTFTNAAEQNTNEINWEEATLVEKPFQFENTKGTELPSTGGIGTKIFYTMGAVLVIGAGVVLVSRKRAGE